MELLLFIVVGVFILLLLKNEEKFSVMTPLSIQSKIAEGIVPTNNDTMDTHKIGVLDFPNIPKVIKLDNLPDCTVPITFRYGYNQNYIWNNGDYVNIDILRQISRNYILYNNKDRFQLRAVRFSKCNILDNGNAYLLQMFLVHSSPLAQCNFDIVIPLKFTRNNTLQLVTKDQVPQYEGGGKTFGGIVKSELGVISNFLTNTKFKKYDINKKQHIMVSKPMEIDVELGMDILNKLEPTANKILNEESWLENDFMEI